MILIQLDNILHGSTVREVSRELILKIVQGTLQPGALLKNNPVYIQNTTQSSCINEYLIEHAGSKHQ